MHGISSWIGSVFLYTNKLCFDRFLDDHLIISVYYWCVLPRHNTCHQCDVSFNCSSFSRGIIRHIFYYVVFWSCDLIFAVVLVQRFNRRTLLSSAPTAAGRAPEVSKTRAEISSKNDIQSFTPLQICWARCGCSWCHRRRLYFAVSRREGRHPPLSTHEWVHGVVPSF